MDKLLTSAIKDEPRDSLRSAARSVPDYKIFHDSIATEPTERHEKTPRIFISDAPCEPVHSSCPRLLEELVDASIPKYEVPSKLFPGRERATECGTSTNGSGCNEPIGGEKHNAQEALVLSVLALRLNIDLETDTTTCVANTRKGTRCTYRIAKLALEEARKILEGFKKETITREWKTRVDQVQLLASLLHCKRQHQDQADTWSKRWAAAIAPTKVPLAQTEKSTPSRNNDYTAACIRNLIHFDTRAKSIANTTDFVEGALRRELTRREVKHQGYIYIYNFPGNFGHVKIGVTSRMPEERLREWQNQCGHVPELLFPMSEEDLQPIPHVYRIESIVHAQLRNCRKKELRCRKCQKCHVEWFESSVPEATEAVKRWSKWIREEPYEQRSNGSWTLAEGQKEKVRAMCRSIEDERQGQERSRRLSVQATPSRLRPRSECGPRRSRRLADQKRRERRRSMADDASSADKTWTFKLTSD
ncbi:MAG: hypothetical protein Q9168_006965 [Polycauliona sp. 1 TL-2023]